jgi:hypothetical protein
MALSRSTIAVFFGVGRWAGAATGHALRPVPLALALAAALLAFAAMPGGPRWLGAALDFSGLPDLTRPRRFVVVTSFLAAFLSLAYVSFVLHGGPRAAESGAYWIEGRALAHARFAWAISGPTASFRSDGLVSVGRDHLASVMPPAYAVLLAGAFLVGAPMLVGPLVAAGLVFATWLLAGELADACRETDPVRREAVARVAVAFSIVSAALRRGSADIVPDGAAALAVTVALGVALRARRTATPALFAASGAAIGFLFAAQPLASLPLGLAVTALALGSPSRARAVGWTTVAAAPGVALLLAANHAITGHALLSPAGSYFAAVATPAARLGVKAALVAAAHRLGEHLAGTANAEPLAALAFVPVFVRGGSPGARRRSPAALGFLGVTVALGAALAWGPIPRGPGLTTIVPLEQVLAALGLVQLFPNSVGRAVTACLALAVAGLALHAPSGMARVATDRAPSEKGREKTPGDKLAIDRDEKPPPAYEPDVTREANVGSGLLYFDDDLGYELSSDPGVAASHGIEAVRLRSDDHDRLLFDDLGHPAVHRYVVGPSTASIAPFAPGGSGDNWRFEAESDWPLATAHGRSEVSTELGSCASNGRVLTVTPSSPALEATALLELPVPKAVAGARRGWAIAPRAFQRGGPGSGHLALLLSPGGPPVAEWSWTDTGAATKPGNKTCIDLPPQPVELGAERRLAWLAFRATGGAASFDRTVLRGR